MEFRFLTGILAALSVFSVPVANAASIVASDYLDGGIERNFEFAATGWAFTPKQNIYVTALGVYDHDSDGLTDPHEVGIFDLAGIELVSTVVGAGTGVAFAVGAVDGTRFVGVPTTKLFARANYYIVATNFANDDYAFGAGAVSYAPELAWNGFVDCSGNDIRTICIKLGGLPGNLGPNFVFSNLPEPATLALLGLGIAGIGYKRRHMKTI